MANVDMLVYVGPYDEVEVTEAGALTARRDEPVKVGDGPDQIPADVAMRLIEQMGTWAKAPTEKAAVAAKDGSSQV